MNVKIKSESDFWSGLTFALTGVFAIVVARNYPMGIVTNMGPGYFPTAIGILLIVIGSVIAARGLRFDGEAVERSFNLKAIASVSLGLIIFGWGIDNIGFIPSLFALVFFGSLGGKRFSLRETLLLCGAIVLGSWLLFIVLLELPLPLFWER